MGYAMASQEDLTGAALPAAMQRMEEQLGFQRRTWRVQRLAWVALAILLVLGLLGGFGGAGWLATAEAVTPDGALRIEYRRIQRQTQPGLIRIDALHPPPDGRLELRLGPEFLRGWRVQGMLPLPAASRGEAGGLVLTLAVAGASEAPALLLQAEPVRPGIASLAIGAAAGPPARLRMLVWP